MDYRLLLADPDVRQELLENAEELTDQIRQRYRAGGLEGLEGGSLTRRLDDVVEAMLEGRWGGEDAGLEAIVLQFTRPVFFVRGASITLPSDSQPSSRVLADKLELASENLASVIPSVGRIELHNHRLDWVGTGWLVATNTVVTNRHVAQEFSRRRARGFAFRLGPRGTIVRASLDYRREYQESAESRFRVEDILWIEEDDSVDVALIRISSRNELGETSPPPIPMMTGAELSASGIGAWVAVVGYPAYDTRCNSRDQQRIFDGIYDVKRLAPGRITGLLEDEQLHHDATTLGGNSGSLVVDLNSGRAAGLHFGGIGGERNLAVQAPVIARLLKDHASIDSDA